MEHNSYITRKRGHASLTYVSQPVLTIPQADALLNTYMYSSPYGTLHDCILRYFTDAHKIQARCLECRHLVEIEGYYYRPARKRSERVHIRIEVPQTETGCVLTGWSTNGGAAVGSGGVAVRGG